MISFPGYDDYVTSGSKHRCICGATYYDSDGGACHFQCIQCDELQECDDSEDPYMDLCNSCYQKEQQEWEDEL